MAAENLQELPSTTTASADDDDGDDDVEEEGIAGVGGSSGVDDAALKLLLPIRGLRESLSWVERLAGDKTVSLFCPFDHHCRGGVGLHKEMNVNTEIHGISTTLEVVRARLDRSTISKL